MNVKQVIVIRRDLGMRRGKEIAQGAHASGAWLSNRLTRVVDGPVFTAHLSDAEIAWITGRFTKVVCQVNTLEEMFAVNDASVKTGLLTTMIMDNGKTEFDGIPTFTALAIGPAEAEKIDAVTGHLKLY